jgi:hypothetical protein
MMTAKITPTLNDFLQLKNEECPQENIGIDADRQDLRYHVHTHHPC